MTKILVIEDDFEVKSSIVDILESESFQAIDASNGLAGLKLAKECTPDLILCDVMMPKIDGYQVLKTLKNNSQTSWIPFIFLTSKTNRTSWRKGMELGADDYITKPFTPRELLKAIAIRSQPRLALPKDSKFAPRSEQIEEHRRTLNFDRNTNLPSRFLFQSKFEELVKNVLFENAANFTKLKKLKLPLLYLQINNFAEFEDSLGDRLINNTIQAIAENLRNSTFAAGFIAYLNRGVFGILLPSVESRQEMILVIERINRNLAALAHKLAKFKKSFNTCIGVSFYPDCGTNIFTLIEKAKSVMQPDNCDRHWQSCYPNNGHRYILASSKCDRMIDSLDRFFLQRSLSQTIKSEGFTVDYQPYISFSNVKIAGCQANINWQDFSYNNFSPEEVVSVAETTGEMVSLQNWLFDKACQQLQNWQRNGIGNFQLCFKASNFHFGQDTFNLDLGKTIQKYSLDFDSIVLEIEEKILLQNPQKAREKLWVLRNLGVHIRLDKVAIGYTNLEYWQNYPITSLKLHWQKLQNLFGSNQAKNIATAVIALAHCRGISVVVRGVKNKSDWQFFAREKCDLVQGCYPNGSFTRLLETYNRN